MNLITRLFLLALVFAAAATPSQARLETARQAREMLGTESWSVVLKIENTARGTAYPATVYATVFEFNDILWFYTDADGTQSLSLHKGRLEQEKADLAPLLRDICAGFTSFTILSEQQATRVQDSYKKLRNGCFVESVFTLRKLQRQGVQLSEANLLLFYVKGGKGLAGHTGLVFATSNGRFFWDPELPNTTMRLPADESDPITLASRVSGNIKSRVQRALFVEVKESALAAGWMLARAAGNGATVALR